MTGLFDVVGDGFFRPLTGYYKSIYWECLRIIYDSYRTELSYGIDRELLVQRLTYYFDELAIGEINMEDEGEKADTPRDKASMFLRRLKDYGWIGYETGSDQKIKVVMPGYAVSVIRNLEAVSEGK